MLTTLVASGSALLVATQEGSKDAKAIYLAGGLAMLGMLPYTVLGIMPTNKQLMSAEKKEDAQVPAGRASCPLNIAECSLPGVTNALQPLHNRLKRVTSPAPNPCTGQEAAGEMGQAACSADSGQHRDVCRLHVRSRLHAKVMVHQPGAP